MLNFFSDLLASLAGFDWWVSREVLLEFRAEITEWVKMNFGGEDLGGLMEIVADSRVTDALL